MRVWVVILAAALTPVATADLIDIVEFQNFMQIGDDASWGGANDVTYQDWVLSTDSGNTHQLADVIENQIYADVHFTIQDGTPVYSMLYFVFDLVEAAEYRFNGYVYANAPAGWSSISLDDAAGEPVHYEGIGQGHRRFDYEGWLPAGRYRFLIRVEGDTDGDAQAWFTVPEPGTLGLLVIGGVLAAGRRGRG